MEDRQEGLLEEFRTLRQELLGVQTARLWGTLIYVMIAGGVTALQTKSSHPPLYLFLILIALPLLWHTANRERSRLRIAAYINVVIEPQVPGLGWHAHLKEWRNIAPGKTRLEKIVDRWRYILALTGVYVAIIAFSFIFLLVSSGSIFLKLIGVVGVALCAEAHRYLDTVLCSGGTYNRIFQEASNRLSDRPKENLETVTNGGQDV